jgi:acetyltransferase-like isoleucine patch superfamily enzyme
VIYENVEIGQGSSIADSAVVGEPRRGERPGQRATRIGRDAIVRGGSVIYAGTVIGDRFQSGHGSLIRENNMIGDNCSVGTNAVLEPGNRIGSGSRIHSGCFLEHTELGENVFLGPNVVFTDDPHPACPRYLECVLGAKVEADVSIGANSTILPGLRIGRGAVVGAGSVVTKDVEPGIVVAGNPARIVKRADELVCLKGFFNHPYEWREKRRDTVR